MKEHNINNNNKVLCPNCHTRKATATTPGAAASLIILSTLIVTIISLFIPVLGWAMFPIAAILLFASIILAPFIIIFGKVSVRCKHCGKVYSMTRDEFKRYTYGDRHGH